MTIVALGMDLTRIERLEEAYRRHGERLIERLFTPGERRYCDARKERFVHYAGRFAVKEAVMKVLGTGWAKGVRWVDIEVVRESGSAPGVVLHGESARLAAASGIERILITITHDAGVAAAVALAEGRVRQASE
jgi:holo-[acyl-carrier protein] synthase